MQTPSRRNNAAGFSLIELLVVVALIAILAGLTMAGFSLVTEKTNRNKAGIQIKLLESALEKYNSDNRAYPAHEEASGQGGSEILFKALYEDGFEALGNGGASSGGSSSTKAVIYLPDLDPTLNKEGKGGQQWVRTTAGGSTAQIIDPWGHAYLYRTGGSAINKDFDIWSMGKDGKTNASDPKAKDSRDDIRNFQP